MIELNPSIKNHHILSDVCKPLNKLGVVFFGYTAVDSQNNAFCLGSKAEYAFEYLNSGHAKSDVHYRDNRAKDQYEYNFWDFTELKTTSKALYQMAADFDQSHTLSITRHEADMTHCYHFSGAMDDEAINQRYFSHLDSLHAYIDYFDECLLNMPEIAAVYDHPVHLGQQERAPEIQLLTSNPKEIDLVTQGSQPLRFKHFYHYYLTKKERNCLYWLKQGKSADMIASINEISCKTVERYIASIKKKFGCYTMFQLGAKVSSAGLIDFLLAA
ncbi:helix-turn-helix transcriptional regulator [Legionella shakespearei]|uniref:Transcriptional regulator LuxR n=1 Tax=Legionella shakespearei DSM 23087 TaxID=1122169 RepID=A0A0W0YHG5_9GAMM|nr:helix-turn-helix domain-containing protein [Legionella shakespearei]KTD56401.1 transcriptional regulator LuxR [Legionella shakespearei DSM 23087]